MTRQVLVVASWYPNIVDPAAGRFVADQVVALAGTGRVAPRVIAFDPLRLVGGARMREHQAPVVQSAVTAAMEYEDRLFVPGYGVAPAMDVARLGVAEGSIPSLGTTAGVDHRQAVLRPLAARLARDASSIPALVHAHTGYPDGAAGAALADDLGCPLVFTEHATFLAQILAEPGQRARYAAAAARAARIIAVSSVLANQLRAALPEIEERLVVIPNVVAVDEFQAAPLAERRADELLFVGYRKEIKGIGMLLEAFAIIHARRPTARLRLIGGNADVDLEARWREEARRHGIDSAVAFEDVATREEVVAAMSRASVFVHASRYETFGVVAAEALAAGMPIVATASGGVSEILGDEPSSLGAVVPVDDAQAFAAAVLEVLERRPSFDPARLHAAAERFGPAIVGGRLADLYDDVIAESGPLARSPVSRVATIEPDRAREPAGVESERSTVVLALDRRAAATLLAKLPEALPKDDRARDVGSTAGHRATRDRPAPGGRRSATACATELPAARRARRTDPEIVEQILRVLSHPVATLRARRDPDAVVEERVSKAAEEVRRALLRPAYADLDRSPRFVALDGLDAEVAERLAGGDGRALSIGGIRRLADEWSASLGDGSR